MEILNLTDRINKAIQQSYITSDVELDYQSTFSNEGERKANYIIDDLNYRASRDKLDLQKLCFLSVGGADGSEIEKVLIETSIKYGILIEISDYGAQIARERAAALKTKLGKELHVIQGDAFDKLDVCLRTIKHYSLTNAIDGLVVSAQAVLHELPRRSKNYDSVVFFGKLYGDPSLRNCFLYSREPCKPQGWPDRVRIRIAEVKNDDLFRLACHVRDRLQIKGTPEILGTNWLDLESDLAVETLHKLLRNDTVSRIEYELGEQLTEFDPIAFKRNLESCVDGMKVSLDYITTLGFKRALTDNKVDFVGHNSDDLPFPKTHVEIVGIKILKSTTHIFSGNSIEMPYKEENFMNDVVLTNKGQFIPSYFTNVFDGDISNQKIIDYLFQFDPDEIPILLKLIEHFTYINPKKLEEYCRILYQRVGELYKESVEDIVFVALGKSSKSSGIISYYFRTVNNIDEGKFLSSDAIESHLFDDKIVVFIDDLLASGHQAAHEFDGLINKRASRMCLAVLVSCEQGVELMQERSNIDIVSVLKINRTDSPFDSKNSILNSSDKTRLEEIVNKYSSKVGIFNSHGYAGLSLLLGFFYNTPDNTLPIFWSSNCTASPLLKRDNFGRGFVAN